MNSPDIPLSRIRKEYSSSELLETSVLSHPVSQFEKWMNEALVSGVKEPTAMALSSVSSSGRPSCRIVLLKEVSVRGFTFFSNYESRKGKELEQNPFASLTFFWAELERQVRIEGTIKKTSRKESEEYFSTRPRNSQIGAWVSHQSSEISKEEILNKLAEEESRWEGKSVECPPYWGGFILKPEMIEFWQGRPSRLHDRIAYSLKNGNWNIKRLSP
jgi:pyridoxamine 5'-phosphate oxidase